MANTFTNLHYHLVFSTKNREPFLREQKSSMHEYLGGCIRKLGATALCVGGIADHVHALVRMKPTHRLSDVLRDIKRPSSDWIQELIPSFHWQVGYSAFTVSASQIDRVCRYIERQEEHHQKQSFEEELREILTVHGIEFDERYLL
ncbi:MAG TPA: IS200/IS605 family transposase [Thermoanaerobaculia bacterium]